MKKLVLGSFIASCAMLLLGSCSDKEVVNATSSSSSGGSSTIGQTYTVNDVSFTMIPISGGSFYMGAQNTSPACDNYDADANSDENPVHKVNVSDFSLGSTEVTQALWYAVMGNKPTSDSYQWSTSYGLGDSYPAYYVSYTDVQSFITKLNALTGKSFRLPTEAEWEYAARGGTSTKGYKYSGSNTLNDVGWYASNTSSSNEVGLKKYNELYLYDMSGNLAEWCSDWYASYSDSVATQQNPTGPTSGTYRVIRGGYWNYSGVFCRVANRDYCSPGSRRAVVGFRLAL